MRVRTGYSFRKAFGHLPDVLSRIETDYAPITDSNSTFGFNRWTKLCKEKNKKPIYGLEIGVTASVNERRIAFSHMTFIARERLAPLHQLLAKATSQFKYEPLLTYEDLANVDPSLTILIGKAPLLEYVKPDKRYGLLLAPSTAQPLVDWAKDNRIAMYPSSDNRYPDPDDQLCYNVLAGKMANNQSYPQHILSREEWLNIWPMPDLFKNNDKLAASCKATMAPAELFVPERKKSLEQLCTEGAKKLNCDLKRKEYNDRLTRELEMIRAKNFEDYFFIIADMIAEAKKHMFVGPARGSSCGSLVCYLLGITTIDPIPHQLLFERFIDINRKDLPDIDIDFSDQNRHIIFEYMTEKYGKEHVAKLGTVALYKPRSAVNEVGAAMKIPKWRVEEFTNSIIERSSGDSRYLYAIEDTFKETDVGKKLIEDFPEILLAQRLEGHPRHSSSHAAGIVVTKRPIMDHIGIDTRTGATQCDKADAEDLNFLKIDALGLTQLSVFEDCLKMIGKNKEWLIDYPLGDKKAFEILNNKKFTGIFQWNGQSLQSLTRQIQIKEFEDIVAITALARPGPMTSGGATLWAHRKNGNEPVVYPHPKFEPILKSSLGITVYQEQVMQIVREIGNFSWEDTSTIRKAMSGRKGEEYFALQGQKFKAGAIKNGLPKEILDKIWNDLCTFGAWGFNRSHAVAYGYISYWCCVLKAHYELEFAAATLSHESDPDKQLKLLRELADEGISYKAIDIEKSTDKWTVFENKLIGPLHNVRGIGTKMMKEILHCRELKLPLPKRAAKMLLNPITTIDELYPLEARLKQILPDPKEAGIISPLSRVKDLEPKEQEQTHVVVAKVININPRDVNEAQKVAKRGYTINGSKTTSLMLLIEDDTDKILANINRYKFESIGKQIVERGEAGNVIYCFKGNISKGFRMLHVERVKFIGKMKDEEPMIAFNPEEEAEMIENEDHRVTQ